MTGLLLNIFFAAGIDQAQYKTLLNSNLVYDIAASAEGAWCATNGGVRFFSLADSAYTRSFTNVEGLPHNICRSLVQMPSGEIWAGTDRGPALIQPDRGLVSTYQSLTDQVYSLALAGDTLAAATSNGVVLLLMNGTPADLSDDVGYTPVPLRDRTFRKASWFKGDLWLADSGKLWRYIPQLDSVLTFSSSSGLGSLDIRDLDAGSSLLALNPAGVFRYNEFSGAFDTVFTFSSPTLNVSSLAHKSDTIYVATQNIPDTYKRLIRYIESSGRLDTAGFWVSVPEGSKYSWVWNIRTLEPGSRGELWIGCGGQTHDLYGSGLVLWDEASGRYNGYGSPGLNSNYAWHVLADGNGGAWTSHWLAFHESGVTGYSDSRWYNFLIFADTSIPFNYSTKVSAADSWGRLVFGSWWNTNGITRFDPYSASWEDYSWGYKENLNVIAWLAVDPLDRIWVSHFNAKRMTVISPDLREETVITWPYDHVRSMEFDPSGIVWAAGDAGLVSYTPPDFETNLVGGEFDVKIPGPPVVWDIALDGSAGVWGVTAEGAFHWTPEGVTRYGVPPFPEIDLVSVDRDPWGRVYFLCKNEGLVVYDPVGTLYDTTQALWHCVNCSNSPLVRGFEYTWLDVDRAGNLAVGTAGGGVSLITLPRYADTAQVSVRAYPNPCYASFGLPVRFTPLEGVTGEGAQSVTVYTVSGEKVAEIAASDFVTIQGTREAELDVSDLAAGLYIAVVRFATSSQRVKFVIVR